MDYGGPLSPSHRDHHRLRPVLVEDLKGFYGGMSGAYASLGRSGLSPVKGCPSLRGASNPLSLNDVTNVIELGPELTAHHGNLLLAAGLEATAASAISLAALQQHPHPAILV